MWTFFRRYKRFFLVLGLLSAVIVFLFFRALQPNPVLPIYQPAMVDPVLVDESIQYVKKYHRIVDFSLTNQNNETVTHSDYDGHIYVADFFFTTCPSICPIMTDNMVHLQSMLNDLPEVKLLSFSVTPAIDTPQVLQAYAEKKGVDQNRWNLVTGDKKEIYNLARKSYLVVQEDGSGDEHDMIHTENFVLVDASRRIRGFYDGTQRDVMDQILADIQILRKEK
jgi:protein SCO1/2